MKLIMEAQENSCNFKENSQFDDHYSEPEMAQPHNISDFEKLIDKYKEEVKLTPPHTPERRELVDKLVKLRLGLLELKDGEKMMKSEGRACETRTVMGHAMEEREWGRARGYCEVCCGIIIGIFQAWYKCRTCSYCCHKKCLSDITRTCTTVKISENPTFIMNICPEQGLHLQNYRCYECKAAIGFQPSTNEARQCDYNGLFYCNKCHWNDSMAIPARVVSNWDFDLKKVCRSSKSCLRLMLNRPAINIQSINPMLFTYLEELNEVKNRRIELLMMKKFFLECPRALRERLLRQLQHRQHFVDGPDMYSMNDLIDLTNDILLQEITRIHAAFVQHIKFDCETCQRKGQLCTICQQDGEVLFPFDCTATVCATCNTIMHLHCYQMKNQKCPKCST